MDYADCSAAAEEITAVAGKQSIAAEEKSREQTDTVRAVSAQQVKHPADAATQENMIVIAAASVIATAIATK